MLTINKIISMFCVQVMLSLVLVASAGAQELLSVTGVTVTAARAAKSDVARLRKSLKLTAESDQEIEDKHPVYVVKVFTRFQPGAAQVTLAIGGTPVPQFGAFKEGIFFKIYDPARLAAFSGQPLKLVRRGPKGEEPAVDAASLPRFPAAESASASATAQRRKSVEEVLREAP